VNLTLGDVKKWQEKMAVLKGNNSRIFFVLESWGFPLELRGPSWMPREID
jgi:hypothetical protein